MDGLRVFCADIGSVSAGKFGWAASNTDGQLRESGSDIRELARRIVDPPGFRSSRFRGV